MIAMFFFNMRDYGIYSVIYFVCLFALTIAQYTYSTLSLIVNMYQSHRLAFNTHIKSIMSLFVATFLSLVFCLCQQLYITHSTVCSYGGEPMTG